MRRSEDRGRNVTGGQQGTPGRSGGPGTGAAQGPERSLDTRDLKMGHRLGHSMAPKSHPGFLGKPTMRVGWPRRDRPGTWLQACPSFRGCAAPVVMPTFRRRFRGHTRSRGRTIRSMIEDTRATKVRIKQIDIKNYRLFKDVTLSGLPRLVVVIGANGTGKSTLFDVFSFLQDALNHGVEFAVSWRGGFRNLVSRGQNGPIEIEIKFGERTGRQATYMLSVGLDESEGTVVDREVLRCRRGEYDRPWHFATSVAAPARPSRTRRSGTAQVFSRSGKSTRSQAPMSLRSPPLASSRSFEWSPSFDA